MTVDPSFGPPAYPPQRKSRTWLWILAGCGCLLLVTLVIAGIGAGVFFGVKAATAEPEKVVREFLAAGAAGDAARAHGYFSEALQKEQPLEQFTQIVQNNERFFHVMDTTYTKREVDLSKATLAGTLTLQDASKVPCEFVLVKENGAWKLISYNIGS